MVAGMAGNAVKAIFTGISTKDIDDAQAMMNSVTEAQNQKPTQVKPLKIRWQHDLDNDSFRGSDGHFSFFHISFFFRMDRA